MLPTLVLGGLHWFQLVRDHEAELAEVPAAARAAAAGMEDALGGRFEALIARENERPFTVYRDFMYPADLVGSELALVPSPLTKGTPPPGILSWFTYDLSQGIDADHTLLAGNRPSEGEWREELQGIHRSVKELIAHDVQDGPHKQVTRRRGHHVTTVPLSLAVVNFSGEKDHTCLLAELPALRRFDDEFVNVHRYDFYVRFYHEADGTPRVVATRLLMIDESNLLQGMPECYSNLAKGAAIYQGFFIDPAWLFDQLPRELSKQLLRAPEVFRPSGMPDFCQDETEVAEAVYPVQLLEMETYGPDEADFGSFQVAISTKNIRARHTDQYRRFAAVAFMLLLSLGTGMGLLLRSVKQELEQARRTENFVAAVTHELRTPLAAIRLYGEMLRDGWVSSPEKKDEYYGRIVTEAHRLESMVERVLEKSRVTSAAARPEPGDVNELVNELFEKQLTSRRDLRLELAPNMPQVLMTREAMRSIVVNLIENARKYAPVEQPGGEPILVRTALLEDTPCLEVLDRGPGIPDEDKSHLFEAFYRRGDEGTRRARGTGLGLHLVKIQAQAMGGDAFVLDRQGGGTIFRVSLKQPGEESAS